MRRIGSGECTSLDRTIADAELRLHELRHTGKGNSPGRVLRRWTTAGGALFLLFIGLAGCLPTSRGGDLVPGTVLSRYDWQQPAAHWRLPGDLEEASGADFVGLRRVLTHDDNVSTLWTVTYHTRGGPPEIERLGGQRDGPAEAVQGDFEGVARLDGSVYLLRSPGSLHRASVNPRATALSSAFETVATGVEGRCNFEGLAARPVDGSLFLACKYPQEPEPGTILLFRLKPGATHPPRSLRIDVSAVLTDTRLERLRPSGLAWLAETDRLLVLAGKERIILELSSRGTLLAWRRLPRHFHRQAEGLSLSPGGDIVVVDEADGRTASFSLYPRRTPRQPVELSRPDSE